MNGWVGGRTDGWMDGWAGEWMEGFSSACIFSELCLSYCLVLLVVARHSACRIDKTVVQWILAKQTYQVSTSSLQTSIHVLSCPQSYKDS